MKYIRKVTVLKLLIILSIGANADTIKFQVPACITDDLLKEFDGYIYDNDIYGMDQLINSGYCIVLREGDQVSRIKYGFVRSEIRVNGVKYHLASEALSDQPRSQQYEKSKTSHTKTSSPAKSVQKKTKLEVPPVPAGSFVVQTTSTPNKDAALNIQTHLIALGYKPRLRTIESSNGIIYRVFTEYFQNKEQAIAAKKRIDESLKLNSLVLPYKP